MLPHARSTATSRSRRRRAAADDPDVVAIGRRSIVGAGFIIASLRAPRNGQAGDCAHRAHRAVRRGATSAGLHARGGRRTCLRIRGYKVHAKICRSRRTPEGPWSPPGPAIQRATVRLYTDFGLLDGPSWRSGKTRPPFQRLDRLFDPAPNGSFARADGCSPAGDATERAAPAARASPLEIVAKMNRSSTKRSSASLAPPSGRHGAAGGARDLRAAARHT